MSRRPYELRTTGGPIAVRGGRIVRRAGPAAPAFEVDGSPREGLINAHDHLDFNHYPRLGNPPYTSLYEWAGDVQARLVDELAEVIAFPRSDALRFGALKNLIAGVTAVAHHGRWSELFERDFPLRVPRLRVIHSLGLEDDLAAAIDRCGRDRSHPLCLHLAEGTVDAVGHEVARAGRLGLLDHDLLAVHLVGVDARGLSLLRAARAAAVWCPSSNLYLYGSTAPPALFDGAVDVLLGSDSLASAAGTLLDELRVARGTRRLPDAALLDAVGPTAARRLGLQRPSLEPGQPADFAVFRAPVLDARPPDVALVVVAGRPRYGDAALAELFEYCGTTVEPITVWGREKIVARPLGSAARGALALGTDCGRIFGGDGLSSAPGEASASD